MGCGNPKEKIEDEIMKMKMKRTESQMERYNQLEKLKNLHGLEIKPSIIPDYIDGNFLREQLLKRINLSFKEDNFKGRRRTKRSKSFAIKKNTKIFNISDKETVKTINPRRKTIKRKTLKF